MERLKPLIKLLLPPLAAFYITGIASADSFLESLSSFAGIATLVPIVVEALKVRYALSGKQWAGMPASRLLSWILSLLLVYSSWLIGWSFSEMSWIWAGIYGIGAGLVSNRYFSLEQVQWLLALLTSNQDKLIKLKK